MRGATNSANCEAGAPVTIISLLHDPHTAPTLCGMLCMVSRPLLSTVCTQLLRSYHTHWLNLNRLWHSHLTQKTYHGLLEQPHQFLLSLHLGFIHLALQTRSQGAIISCHTFGRCRSTWGYGERVKWRVEVGPRVVRCGAVWCGEVALGEWPVDCDGIP